MGKKRKCFAKTSLVVQWLRRHAPRVKGLGSSPGQGICIPHAATKIPQATMKLEDPVCHN